MMIMVASKRCIDEWGMFESGVKYLTPKHHRARGISSKKNVLIARDM